MRIIRSILGQNCAQNQVKILGGGNFGIFRPQVAISLSEFEEGDDGTCSQRKQDMRAKYFSTSSQRRVGRVVQTTRLD